MIRLRNVSRGTVRSREIIDAYKKAFHFAWWYPKKPFYLADEFYKETDQTFIQDILAKDKTNLETYVTEFFDCDDYAFRLMGIFHQNGEVAAMPIFITWVLTSFGGHAVLSYYKSGEIYIIEPQNDNIYSVPKNWKLLLLCG